MFVFRRSIGLALLLALLILLLGHTLVAQQTGRRSIALQKRATDELNAVLAEAPKLDNAFAIVLIKSKSAALLSFADPARADTIFVEVWRFANEWSEPAFDRDRALNTVLKYLFPRNAKLAKQLLGEELKNDPKSDEGVLTPDSNRKLARLSSELIELDPVTASILLERHLSQGVSPIGLGALQRLREKDPLLSDYVVTRVLDGLAAAPTLVSLGSLYLLSSYLFPESYAFVLAPQFEPALDALQFRYFSIANEALKRSLLENETGVLKERNYTATQLSVRTVHQAQMSLVLAALSIRYQPTSVGELNLLSTKLTGGLPANMVQMGRYTAARLNPQQQLPENAEMAIPLAMAKGDFQEASFLIDRLKSEEQRNRLSQLLITTQAKSALGRGEIEGALTFIRRVDDTSARLVLYIEASKAAYKRGNRDVSRAIVSEARTLVPQTDRNGLHIRALLSFSSQFVLMDSTEDAAEFLHLAILSLNALKGEESTSKSLLESAWAEMNDPLSLLSAPELERAFASLGSRDLERTLAEATKIHDRAIRLVARLDAIQPVIRTGGPMNRR